MTMIITATFLACICEAEECKSRGNVDTQRIERESGIAIDLGLNPSVVLDIIRIRPLRLRFGCRECTKTAT
jgi:hypothetical protein